LKKYLILITILYSSSYLFGQNSPLRNSQSQEGKSQSQSQNGEGSQANIDSLRSKMEARKDSVVYTSKYIKFTKEEFLRDSTRIFLLDTAIHNFHQYRILDLPESPTINLGLNGLAYRDLLFEPSKSIGFDLGFHYYDRYLLKPQDVIYYQARAPYTELYLENPAFGRLTELQFHVIHSQNIKPNWNIGASFAKMGSRFYYGSPNKDAELLAVNHLNASLWSWYESKNKRYTLLANSTFNNLKSYENGSILNDSIFTTSTNVDPEYENNLLNTAKHNWKNNNLFIKQFYNIGRQKLIDSADAVLPTQRISYTFNYSAQKYFFTNTDVDETGLLNNYFIYQDSSQTADSTLLNHLQNEFNYSFYLRGKSLSFLKNELKVNAGLKHDYYDFQQYNYQSKFQNITLKGDANYGFNDKASLNLKVQQIIQGKNFGDYLYQASSEIKLGNKIGRIILDAYTQNQSPAIIYEKQFSNHYQWDNNFQKTKTQHFGFSYLNSKYNISAKAQYYLIANHLYFNQGVDGDATPAQFASNINLLKLCLKKDFKFGKFTLENYLVYQKTDFESVLRTPEVYTFHSFYFHIDLYKVLKTEIGVDVRYFSKYTASSYAPAIGQFYNSGNNQFNVDPVADFWIRTNWKRANLFLRYDYLNKGLFSNGYYTVNNYPMPYSLAKFGLSWRFYD
jgi:hypothetical protein